MCSLPRLVLLRAQSVPISLCDSHCSLVCLWPVRQGLRLGNSVQGFPPASPLQLWAGELRLPLAELAQS